MPIKDLLDQIGQHPKTVAVGLFACLIVGGVGAVFYLKISEARIALVEERMKRQEEEATKQKHINRLVQDQVGTLRKSFDGLPRAFQGFRSVLAESAIARQVPNKVQERLQSALGSFETQLIEHQTAILSSEALSKQLHSLVKGAIAEEERRFADAALLYRQAANAGVPEAQARLARLYLTGRGVNRDEELAARLLETSALLGSVEAKDDAVKLYLAGHSSTAPELRAAALLSIEPTSSVQQSTLELLTRRLATEQRLLALRTEIETLRAQQRALLERGGQLRIE